MPKTRLQGAGRLRISDNYDNFQFTTGNVFFVDSNAASGGITAGFGRSPESAFLTLSAAYSTDVFTANKGDVCYVLPGHVETLATAGAIAADIEGVHVIGLGKGRMRPTFTWSAVGSSWLITAANTTIENIRCTSSVDEMVSMFACSAAGCTFDKVDVFETTSCQIIQFLLTTADADDLTIENCRHFQSTAAAAAQIWIQLVGTDNTVIRNNSFHITAAASTSSDLIGGTTAVTRCLIDNNRMVFLGATIDSVVNLVTTSTGVISNNRALSGTSVATATAFIGDACLFAENYWLDDSGGSALLAPGVGSD